MFVDNSAWWIKTCSEFTGLNRDDRLNAFREYSKLFNTIIGNRLDSKLLFPRFNRYKNIKFVKKN